jgi:hypothetical protein
MNLWDILGWLVSNGSNPLRSGENASSEKA